MGAFVIVIIIPVSPKPMHLWNSGLERLIICLGCTGMLSSGTEKFSGSGACFAVFCHWVAIHCTGESLTEAEAGATRVMEPWLLDSFQGEMSAYIVHSKVARLLWTRSVGFGTPVACLEGFVVNTRYWCLCGSCRSFAGNVGTGLWRQAD